MTALGVAAVLAVLAVVCLSLASWRTAAQARERETVQAVWNARAGREHYLATGQVTEELRLDPQDPGQVCLATRQSDGSLVFEGVSGKVHRQLVCKAGDPSQVVEP